VPCEHGGAAFCNCCWRRSLVEVITSLWCFISRLLSPVDSRCSAVHHARQKTEESSSTAIVNTLSPPSLPLNDPPRAFLVLSGRSCSTQLVWVAGEMVITDGNLGIDPHCHSEGDTTVHDHPADAEFWICESALRRGASARLPAADWFGSSLRGREGRDCFAVRLRSCLVAALWSLW